MSKNYHHKHTKLSNDLVPYSQPSLLDLILTFLVIIIMMVFELFWAQEKALN